MWCADYIVNELFSACSDAGFTYDDENNISISFDGCEDNLARPLFTASVLSDDVVNETTKWIKSHITSLVDVANWTNAMTIAVRTYVRS